MVLNRTWLLWSATLGALWFGACNVYDASILTGDDESEAGAGGTSSSGGNSGNAGSSAGSSGSGEGGTNGSGGITPEGGAGGEDTSSGGAATGGTSGSSSGGSSGAGGKGGTAGDAGASSGGTSGAGTGNGGAAGSGGSGGAGTSGTAGGGTGGAAGTSSSGGAGGTGGPIVQLPGTATADSEQANPVHPASHGNDGATDTRWCAADGNAGHYWVIDLGAVHPLTRFEVMWEYPSQAAGLSYGYVVSVSSDGTTYAPSIDRSTNTDTAQIQTSDFPPSTSGRYVRITVVTLPASTPRATWASFWEVRVFGQ